MEQGSEKLFVTDKKLEKEQVANSFSPAPTPGRWLDQAKYDSEYSLVNLQQTMNMSEDIFRDFFGKVLSEKPDYIVLFDKGARPFGTPFKKYLNDLHLEKTPEIVFLNPRKGTDSIQKMLTQRDIAKDYEGKKIFIVDEVFYKGNKTELSKKLFDTNSINGHFFAFGTEPDFIQDDDGNYVPANDSEKYTNDERVTIYEGPEIISKNIAALYMVNSEVAGSSERRFNTSETDPKLNVSQEELREVQNYATDIQRKASEIIYQGLKKMNLHP